MPTTVSASANASRETSSVFNCFPLPASIRDGAMEAWKIFDTWSFNGRLIENKTALMSTANGRQVHIKPNGYAPPFLYILWQLKSWAQIYGFSCYILRQLMPEYKTQAHKLQFN